jgi:hypothetical protein
MCGPAYATFFIKLRYINMESTLESNEMGLLQVH